MTYPADMARARRLLEPLVEALAEALEAEREAVIDRLHGCIGEYVDSDRPTAVTVDLPGLIKELRRAGEID